MAQQVLHWHQSMRRQIRHPESAGVNYCLAQPLMIATYAGIPASRAFCSAMVQPRTVVHVACGDLHQCTPSRWFDWQFIIISSK